MFICAAGDVHGALHWLYEDVLAFEASLGIRFDYVLQVGDFGIWPDPGRVDKATRDHDGAGDFPEWLAAKREVPRPTIFIQGNHEDFQWLHGRRHGQILPNLMWLRNGATTDLKDPRGGCIRVGGVGGCYGPSNYTCSPESLQGNAKRHYTRDEITRLACVVGVDIALFHDAPTGVRFEGCASRIGYTSKAEGLAELLARVRPRVCFFGHHHRRVDANIEGVQCIGLNKVSMPGDLVALEIAPGERGWRLLAEYQRGSGVAAPPRTYGAN